MSQVGHSSACARGSLKGTFRPLIDTSFLARYTHRLASVIKTEEKDFSILGSQTCIVGPDGNPVITSLPIEK